jgi:sodium/potassium/calcium exchanger 3
MVGRSETLMMSNATSSCSGAASQSGDGGANGKCLDKESDAGASVFDRWPLSLLRDPLTLLWQYTMPDPEKYCWPLFAASILWIALCTYLMVDATARIGEILRIPTYVMGLLFLAAGTSIPDAMGSIAVAKDGKGDMAIANALGSNIFDILLGLGLPWCIQCLRSGEDIVFENVFDTLKVDLVLLYSVLCIFVGSLALNRWRLNRKIGCVLCMFYGCFAIFVILDVYVFKTRA